MIDDIEKKIRSGESVDVMQGSELEHDVTRLQGHKWRTRSVSESGKLTDDPAPLASPFPIGETT